MNYPGGGGSAHDWSGEDGICADCGFVCAACSGDGDGGGCGICGFDNSLAAPANNRFILIKPNRGRLTLD